MFEDYTRGLIKRLDDVTRFSTLVGDMIRKTNEAFPTKHFDSVEGDFDNIIIKTWVLSDTDELYKDITIRAQIDENDNGHYHPFVMKIQISLNEEINAGDHPGSNTVSTMITVFPGGECYSGTTPTNIYNQNDFHRCGRPSAIEIGYFDRSINPLEWEVNLSYPDDYYLKSDWDHKGLRTWFEDILESIDDIYNTKLCMKYKDENYDYAPDQILNPIEGWE